MGRSPSRGRRMGRRRLGGSRSTPTARDRRWFGWLVGFEPGIGSQNFDGKTSFGIVFGDVPDRRIADRQPGRGQLGPSISQRDKLTTAPKIGLIGESRPRRILVGRIAHDIRESLRNREPIARCLGNVVAGFDNRGEWKYESARSRCFPVDQGPNPVMIPSVIRWAGTVFAWDLQQAAQYRRIQHQDATWHYAVCPAWDAKACSIKP